MRGLGAVALILIILSFLFWIISWSYWNFLVDSFGLDSPFRYVAITCNVLSVLSELLAVGLLSIGLILAAKRLPKA